MDKIIKFTGAAYKVDAICPVLANRRRISPPPPSWNALGAAIQDDGDSFNLIQVQLDMWLATAITGKWYWFKNEPKKKMPSYITTYDLMIEDDTDSMILKMHDLSVIISEFKKTSY